MGINSIFTLACASKLSYSHEDASLLGSLEACLPFLSSTYVPASIGWMASVQVGTTKNAIVLAAAKIKRTSSQESWA